jgi:hypothetical protein
MRYLIFLVASVALADGLPSVEQFVKAQNAAVKAQVVSNRASKALQDMVAGAVKSCQSKGQTFNGNTAQCEQVPTPPAAPVKAPEEKK